MQCLPRCLGQGRLCADKVANHLPRRQVQRALRRRSHRERNRALRTKTNSSRRRFLPRTNPRRLGKQEHGDRFLACLEFPITAKAILTIQRKSPASMPVRHIVGDCTARHLITFTFSNDCAGRQVRRKIPAIPGGPAKPFCSPRKRPSDEPSFTLGKHFDLPAL